MMYQEAPDIRSGRILDLPLSRLASLRRAAFKDIISQTSPVSDHPDVIVNTHATFRWRHGLFSAFDFDQMSLLKPNMFICLLDNVEMAHHRLHNEHEIDATLKDCMVWREEEIIVTELLANAMGCHDNFYILSRGRYEETPTPFHWNRPEMWKVYPSFPMVMSSTCSMSSPRSRRSVRHRRTLHRIRSSGCRREAAARQGDRR